MSDENKKIDAEGTVDAEVKSKTAKKPAAATKKAKEKSSDKVAKDGNNKKIIEKLQAMGVMSGGNSNSTASNNPKSRGFLKTTIASVVAVLVVSSFVWALNKEASNDRLASSANNNVMSPNGSSPWQPTRSNSQYNNVDYPAYNSEKLQQRMQQQRDQQNKWMQQQQQAQDQQRAQQQKWAQQYQQTQEQYRSQQQKWAQQQQHAREQQRAQQQKWAEQQRQQAQEQQRAQQQQWGQQQQPYYTYPPHAGYQRQSAPSSYNNAPRYQQPGPYYGRQY